MNRAQIHIPDCPYKGLMPYSEEDAPFFFGRETEKDIIIANLDASRLTVLYGPSGVGKSSVLRAGVSHDLREISLQNLSRRGEPEFAVVVFNSWRDDPIKGLLDSVRDSVAMALNVEELEPVQTSGMLIETLEAWTSRLDGDLLIILDQFEEYFLYHPQEDGEGTFAFEFPRAVNRTDLRVSFLISIRDDSLAKLDRFKGRIPNLFDNYLRVKHLQYKAGEAAIEGPVVRYNDLLGKEQQAVSVEPELVKIVLEQVRTGQVSLGKGGKGVVTTGKSMRPREVQIETPYLQLVMTRLWEEEKKRGSYILRRTTLEDLGGAKSIVRTHVDKVMAALPDAYQDVAARVFYHLVTPGGTKIAHALTDLAQFAKLPATKLSPLLDRLSQPTIRILRPVAPPSDKPQALRYEVFHDVLAPAILDWRARYVHQKEQQRQIEAERKRTEEQRKKVKAERERAEMERESAEQSQRLAEVEARSARRFRRLTAALAVVSVVAIVSAGIAVRYYRANKAASELYELTVNSQIEELKKNPATKDFAERLEAELMKLRPSPPPHASTLPEWQINLNDLRDLIEAHNELLKKLNVGDLLDDTLEAQTVENFRQLYDKLKDLDQLKRFFDETSSIRKDFEELESRIQKLQSIRVQNDPEELARIAETADHTEAMYAAWMRLGEPSDSPWPSDKSDLDTDRNIRARLKERFEVIRRLDEERGDSFLQELTREGLQREIVFIMRKNSNSDRIVGEFCKFASLQAASDTSGETEITERLARELADFVSKPDWPGQFSMNPLNEENLLYRRTDLGVTDFETWLREAEGYRLLQSDPRQEHQHDEIMREVRKLIDKVRPNLPAKANKFQRTLKADRNRIDALFQTPAIVKNKADIDSAAEELKSIGENIARFREEVGSCVFPSWFANISIVPDGSVGEFRVALRSRQLDPNFLPLNASDMQPMVVSRESHEGLLPEDFVEEEYWRDSQLNKGWPKYIASINDPSVILRFIPAGPRNPEPFYMATHEITNAQYLSFLNASGAKPVGLTETQKKYGVDDETFLSWTQGPTSPIEWTSPSRTFVVKDAASGEMPVTYVTYVGARSCAEWLGGQLPTVEQHRHACWAGKTSKYPWGEDLSDILGYAHVRANPWQREAMRYNKNKDEYDPRLLVDLPLGAVRSDEDYEDDPDSDKKKSLISDRIVVEGDPLYENRSIWPIASSTKPNDWGLFDMIGNVWEWCQDEGRTVICGGSCLAPEKYISEPQSNYMHSYDSTACDVGFRVVVPASLD